MMSFKTFLKLTEIQTKIASLFPFLIGLLFVSYRFGTINKLNTLVFFSSMLIFDLTTTAINNYMDYRKATDNHDFDYRKERNVIGQEELTEKSVLIVILIMLSIATGLGLYLVHLTNILVLAIGAICFFIGIFYTFGPIPLSRLPLGEFFSGITMGFGIVFLIFYVNSYNLGIIDISWVRPLVAININLIEIGSIILVSLPSVFTIANLMLANNICDFEEDVRNHRFTLPYYIGQVKAVKLFSFLYSAAYFAIIVAVILGVYHPIMFLSLISLIPVRKNTQIFRAKQKKSETFVIAVKNLILINGSIVLFLCISHLLR